MWSDTNRLRREGNTLRYVGSGPSDRGEVEDGGLGSTVTRDARRSTGDAARDPGNVDFDHRVRA